MNPIRPTGSISNNINWIGNSKKKQNGNLGYAQDHFSETVLRYSQFTQSGHEVEIFKEEYEKSVITSKIEEALQKKFYFIDFKFNSIPNHRNTIYSDL